MSEQILIEIEAKTRKAEKELDDVKQALDAIDGASGRADKGMSKFAGAAAGVASAALAAGAALSAYVLHVAGAAGEMENLSRTTGLAVDEFESLAFATRQYGLDAEQVSDISKDLSDKIGEFAKVGTGAFQDFADVTGKSKDEAQAFANSLQGLNSEQQITTIYKELEKVNATSEQTTFVLESLGNDLSKVAPLFAENGKELQTLKSRFDAVNKSIQVSESQQKALTNLATDWDLLTTTLGNAGELIAASLAPAFSSFFNGVIETVPEAANAVYDFIDSFKSLENRESVRGLNEQIDELAANITEKQDAIQDRIDRGAKKYQRGLLAALIPGYSADTGDTEFMQSEVAKMNEQMDLLIAKRDELMKQAEEGERAKQREKGSFTGDAGGSLGLGTGTGDQIAAIEDRFKAEETLLAEKLERELQIIGDNNELKLLLLTEYDENIRAIENESQNEMNDLREAAHKEEMRRIAEEEKTARDASFRKLGYAKGFIGLAMQANKQLFDDNKNLNRGLIIADTAASVMSEYKKGGPVPALLAAGQGALQLAALESSTKDGGGSISGGSGAAQVATTPEPETTVSLNTSDVGGAQPQAQTVILQIGGDGSGTEHQFAATLTQLQDEASMRGMS